MSGTENRGWRWPAIVLGGLLAATVYTAKFFIGRNDKPISVLIVGVVAIVAITVVVLLWTTRRGMKP